jgi:hypothetical protein
MSLARQARRRVAADFRRAPLASSTVNAVGFAPAGKSIDGMFAHPRLCRVARRGQMMNINIAWNCLVAVACLSLASGLPARADQSLPISFTYNWNGGPYGTGGISSTIQTIGNGAFTIDTKSNLYSGVYNALSFNYSQTATTTTTYPSPAPPTTTSETANYATSDLNQFLFSVTQGQPVPQNLVLTTNYVSVDPSSQVAFSANGGTGTTSISYGGYTGPVETGGPVTVNETSLLKASVVGGLQHSTTNNNTVLNMSFTPNFGLDLADLATIGGFQGFDWIQWVTSDPNPVYTAAGAQLSTPFLDPPQDPANPALAGRYPFYYNFATETTTPTYQDSGTPVATTNTLSFFDQPYDSRLQPGQAVDFTTMLVGICTTPTSQPNCYDFSGSTYVENLIVVKWEDNWTGPPGIGTGTGGVDYWYQLAGGGVATGDGSGGVTIDSITYPVAQVAVPELPTPALLTIGIGVLVFATGYRLRIAQS